MPLKGSNYLVMIIFSLLLVSLYGFNQPTFTSGIDKSHSHTSLDGDEPLINSSASKKLPADDFISLKKLIRKPHHNEKPFNTLDKNSQEQKTEQTLTKFQIGIEAGPSMTFIWPLNIKTEWIVKNRGQINVNTNYKPRSSFFTGLRLDYRLTTDLTLSGLLSFARKGSNYKQVITFKRLNQPDTKDKGHLIENFLSLHILPTKIFGNSLRYKIQGGPYTNLIVFDSSDQSSSEAGLTAGIGLEIPLSEYWSIDMHIRNSIGLVNFHSPSYPSGVSPKEDITETHSNLSYLSIGISPEIGSETVSPVKSMP